MNWRSIKTIGALSMPVDDRHRTPGQRIVVDFPPDPRPGGAIAFFHWPPRPDYHAPAVRYEVKDDRIHLAHILLKLPERPLDELKASPCFDIVTDPHDLLRRAVGVAQMGWKPLLDAKRDLDIDPLPAFAKEDQLISKVIYKGWDAAGRKGGQAHEVIRELLFICFQWPFWDQAKATWRDRAADMQKQGFTMTPDRLKKMCDRHLELHI